MMKLVRKKRIEEDAPANNAGGGGIDGIGVGPKGEPGIVAKWQKKYQDNNQDDEHGREIGIALMRRQTPLQENENGGAVRWFTAEDGETPAEVRKGKFAGHDTFIVPSDMYHNVKMQKKKGEHWTRYIGKGPHADAIKSHARKNYGKPIIIQDENTGAMCYASYGKRK